MDLFVIGEAFGGKTPFCSHVSEASRWDHIQALDWLRGHFRDSRDYYMMLGDHARMDALLEEELTRNPRICLQYVQHIMHSNRRTIIDGLFQFDDFVQIFDPAKDLVVDLHLVGSKLPPQAHDKGVADIRKHLRNCVVDGMFDEERLFSYHFPKTRRDRGERDVVTRTAAGHYTCSSLEAAIGHFISYMKTSGLVVVD